MAPHPTHTRLTSSLVLSVFCLATTKPTHRLHFVQQLPEAGKCAHVLVALIQHSLHLAPQLQPALQDIGSHSSMRNFDKHKQQQMVGHGEQF